MHDPLFSFAPAKPDATRTRGTRRSRRTRAAVIAALFAMATAGLWRTMSPADAALIGQFPCPTSSGTPDPSPTGGTQITNAHLVAHATDGSGTTLNWSS